MDNRELGKLILKQIDAFPESFSMGTWVTQTSCGTSACIAGHACLLSGYRIGEPGYDTFFIRPDGTAVTSMVEEGMMLLGLADSEYYGEDETELFFVSDADAVEWLRRLTEDDS